MVGRAQPPSASAAHRYTIDRHMVEVVTRLGRETPSGGRYDDRHYEALLLAGILHDIGKRPGAANHAAEGARHATVVVERMGFDRDIVRWVTLLVREHLTLSEFATGRNPNDPNVGDDLAGRLDHNPVLLDMLFDLTRADGSSLGPRPARPSPNSTGGANGVKRWCAPCTTPPDTTCERRFLACAKPICPRISRRLRKSGVHITFRSLRQIEIRESGCML